jgi:hypothetical protein
VSLFYEDYKQTLNSVIGLANLDLDTLLVGRENPVISGAIFLPKELLP